MLKHYKNKNWVGTTNYEQNLQDIKQDVETLKRNVSYIYKHGTLGGGGTGTGGEVISDDQIVLNYSPTLLSDHGSNICYTDSTGTCKFTFYIKTQTTAKPYSVKITDDKGLVLKSEFTVTSSKNANEINVNLIGLGSTEKIIITAVDKNDIELSPVSIYIKCNQYSVSLTQDNAQSIMDITNIYQTASQFNIMTSCYVPSTTEATITVSINGKTCLNANVNTMGNTLLQYTFGDLFSKGFGRGSKPIIGQRYAITVTFNVYANSEFTLTTNPYYITIMGSESLGLMAEVSNAIQTNLLTGYTTYAGEECTYSIDTEITKITEDFELLRKDAEQNYINYSTDTNGISSINASFQIFAPKDYKNNFIPVAFFAHYFVTNNETGEIVHKIVKLDEQSIVKNSKTNLKIDFQGKLDDFSFEEIDGKPKPIKYIIIEVCASITDNASKTQYASAFFVSNLKEYDFITPTFEKEIASHILYRFIPGDINSTSVEEDNNFYGLHTSDTNLNQKWTYKSTWDEGKDKNGNTMLYKRITVIDNSNPNTPTISYLPWQNEEIDIANGNNITSFNGTKGEQLSGITSYRLSNKAYFKINPIDEFLPYYGYAGEYESFYTRLKNGFTFSFNYRADKHSSEILPILDTSDSFLTINLNELTFNFDVEKTDKTTNSKKTDSQKLNVKLTQAFDNFIDIVCTASAVKIYLNGVLTAAFVGGEQKDPNDDKKTIAFNIVYTDLLQKFTTNNLYIATNKYSDTADTDKTFYTDIDLYGISLYKKALNDFEIIQNYISNKYFTLNNDNPNDAIECVTNIRDRNFITYDKETQTESCPFYDPESASIDFNVTPFTSTTDGNTATTVGFKFGQTTLYAELLKNSNIPIPIIKLQVSSEEYEPVFDTIHNVKESDALNWKLSGISYTDAGTNTNSTIELVNTDTTKYYLKPDGNREVPYFSLQGTSTLNYSSKNFEICFGKTSDGNEILFSPNPNWLPENKFTLKADTMDSAHTNNAAIGKFINDNCFTSMNTISKSAKQKPCLEGFPVLLFIEYNKASAGTHPGLSQGEYGDNTPQFMGIYSFNLGRNSYYNMGYKKLPDVISKYSDIEKLYEITESTDPNISCYVTSPSPSSSIDSSACCFEFKNNDDKAGSFQSDNDDIINQYLEQKYPKINDKEVSWNSLTENKYPRSSLKELFTKLANAYDTTKYTDGTYENSKWTLNNTTPTASKEQYKDTPITFDNLFNTSSNTNTIDFEIANEYFLIAMAFGMVDSLHKNMQLRAWNESTHWYTCFYDMDSCLGLDNNGNENISPTASINHYENYTGELQNSIKTVHCVRAGSSTIYSESTDVNGNVVVGNTVAKSQYSVANNRLFRILTYSGPAKQITNFVKDDGDDDTKFFKNEKWYINKWIQWRQSGGILDSFTNFYEKYFEAQNDKVGELLFNLDYYIKYIQPVNAPHDNYKDSRSLPFLHGRRLGFVKSWLEKRLAFLDSIFLYDYHELTGIEYKSDGHSYGKATSTVPYLNISNAEIKPQGDYKTIKVTTAHPGIVYIAYNDYMSDTSAGVKGTTFRLISDADTPTEIKLPPISGESNQFYINYSNSISSIEGLNGINFKSVAGLKLTNLEKFDLSGVFNKTDIDQISSAPFGTLSNNIFREMPNLKELNISNSTAKTPFDIDVSACIKLHTINISNSSTKSLTLSDDETALTTLNISNSELVSLKICNKSLLTKLNCSGCTKLETIVIDNAPSLKTITGLNNLDALKSIEISNCSNLLYIDIKSCKNLGKVIIKNCPKLQVFGCQCSGEFAVSTENERGIDIDISKIGIYQQSDNTYANHNTLALKKVCIYNCLIKDDVVYLPYESFAKINYLNITASNIAAIGISKISTDEKSIEKKYPQTANSEKILDLSLIYNGEFTASAEKDQTKLTTELLKGSETEYCYTLLSTDNNITTDTGLYINGITAVKTNGTYYETQTDSAGNRKSVFVQPFKTSTVQYIKVNNNDKDNPFVLTTDKFFYGIFKGSNTCVGTRILGHIKLSGSYNYSFNMNEIKGKFYINPESLYETNEMYKACGEYASNHGEYGVIPKTISSPTGTYDAYTGENGLDSYKKFVSGSNDSKNLYVYADEIDIDKVATNISFDSGLTNWTNIFAGTAINIRDLYYIMARAQYAQNLTHAFLACYNLEVDGEYPLCRYTFSECKSATNINGVFCKAFKTFKTPLYSSEYWTNVTRPQNGLLAPLSKCTNITYWCSPLWNLTGKTSAEKGNCYIDDKFFMDLPAVEKMDRIFPSNAASIEDTNTLNRSHAKLHSMYLFANNTKITSVNGCMNYANEYHNYADNKYLELYIGELKVYVNKNCSGRSNTIRALFHQNSDLTGVDNFSGYIDQNGVSNLFISGKITSTIFGGGAGSMCVYWKLPNGVLKTISYSSTITNYYHFIHNAHASSTLKLEWANFNNLFNNIQPKSSITNCSAMWDAVWIKTGNAFPTEIFYGMTNVASVARFFKNHGIKNSSANFLELPGNMFKDCTSLTTVEECFRNDILPSDFYFRLSSSEPRYYYNKTIDPDDSSKEVISVEYSGEYTNFKNIKKDLNVYALFQNAGVIVSKTSPNKIDCNPETGTFNIKKSYEYSGIPSRFFELGNNCKITNMKYCFSGLYSLHNINSSGKAATGISYIDYYSNPIIDYSKMPYTSEVTNEAGTTAYEIKWNYKNLDEECASSSPVSFICKNPSYSTDETNNLAYNPYEYTWNKYAWDGLYKKEFDLLDSDNFIYSGEVYYSYYGELYPIGKSTSSFQTVESFTNYTVYNVTNSYTASAPETKDSIIDKLKTYTKLPTNGTNTGKIQKTITISNVSSATTEFTYNISQNYIVCDISKYASYEDHATKYALGAIPVSVSIELNTEIDLTDKIECFYLGDVANNNYINIKPLSSKVENPSGTFDRPMVSKTGKVYTFTFNTTKRIRYIVFRLAPSSDDIKVIPTDCFIYNGETKQYEINKDSAYAIVTKNDQNEIVSKSLNINGTNGIKSVQNNGNSSSYSITNISISFYPMGYNYNKLDKFNLYKYGPFIREYNSNADRIVSGTNRIQTETSNKNERSVIVISASASALDTNDSNSYCAKISSNIDLDAVYIKQFSSNVKLVYADNYIFPPDLFYYCSNNCNIDYALESLYKETSSSYYNRNFGRIPPMLFESLTSTTSFTGIFKNNRLAITPYFIPYSKTSENKLNAGLMYPTTLFAKNTAMTTLSETFANTVVAYNCVLSGSGEYSGLLTKNTNLSNVSKTFANIHYFGRDINNLGEWEQIFSNNKKLSNLSGCFAQHGGGDSTLPGAISSAVNNIYGFGFDSTVYKPSFPKYIDYIFGDNGKLHSNSVISDITYMFYNQTSLSDGYLPEFNTLKLSSAKYKSCFGNCDFSSSSKFEKDYSKTVYASDSNWTMSTK